MPINQLQPTVLVKKPDGSTARMSLDEVKKMQAQKNSPTASASKSVPATTSAPTPTPAPISTPKTISTPAPKINSTPKPTPNPAPTPVSPSKQTDSKAWDKDDHHSLLREKMDKAPAHLPPLVSKRENEVEEILNKLDFKVSSDNQNRLRAIIQLRLKEIRDDRQTEQTLQRSILEGGLGLLPSQAQKVIVAIKNVLPPNTIKPSGRPVSSTKQIMVEPPDLPQVYREPPVPARSTPFNSFVHSAKTPSSSAMTLEADKKQESKFSLRTPRQTKTVIHDIAPPQLEETQIGPVGEIQQFTLTDFRRLSANPAEAASRLRQKFTNLKDESYLLFIDGLSAWRESPLYNDYLAVLNKSLTQRIDLAQAAGVDNKTLTAPEIMALAEMEREL